MSAAVWIILRAARRDQANAFLANHPELDLLGGGGDTFGDWGAVSESGTLPADAYMVEWHGLDIPAITVQGKKRIDVLEDEGRAGGFKVNIVQGGNPASNWDLATYKESDGWTLASALADLTRKGRVLQRV